MTVYFLRSARLGFRPWDDGDFPLAQGLWSDPEVTRFIGGPFSAEQIAQRFARERGYQKTRGVQYWPIFLLDNDRHVGCCGLKPYYNDDAMLELGFHLRPDYWGKGLAPEAARCVARYAFDTLKQPSLFAGHHKENPAARHILEGLGFEFARDELYPHDGCLHRSYLLSAERFAEVVPR